MGIRCGRHDATSAEAIAQQVREQKWREMVERECALQALRGLLARGEKGSGIVGQHVDVLITRANIFGESSYLGHQRKIGDVLVHRRAAGRSSLARDILHALGLTTNECDLGSLSGVLDRGGAADSPRRSSE
jgi:hypothetical protein